MHITFSLSQTLYFFILSTFLQCILVVPDSTNPTTMAACQPKPCGNLTITYPFWINQIHPSYCGNPSLQINCDDSKSFLANSYGASYYVKRVFYHNNSFVAVSKLFENVPGAGCYVPEFNVSLGIGPFEISPTNKILMFFYNCLNFARPSYDFLHVTCNSNLPQNANESFVRLYVNDTDMPGMDMLRNCSVSKRPVLGWNLRPVEKYMDLMRDGFLVELKVPSCADCKASNGTCGFNASTSSFMCICSDNSTHPVDCPVYTPPETWLQSHKDVALIAISTILGAIMISSACLLLFAKFRRTYILSKQYTELKKIQQRLGLFGPLSPKRYKYKELKKITWSFRENLGQGGFGTVYKGALRDGQLVAVKILHNSPSNMEQFLNEVASIGRTSHVNVVSLLGFCFEGSKQALIYEYMANGSLDKYIYCSDDSKAVLEWERLYEITIGIARGLEYLHQGCNTQIVHFDIKPQNILLDENFHPKIADFGLAKLCPPKESIISVGDMRGTIGFIAPEVFSRSFGAVSTKSDVYSFGMVLLEIVERRTDLKPSEDSNSSQDYFPHWIYHRLLEGAEIQIGDLSHVNEEIARKIALVGLWCTQLQPFNRPSMDRVMEMLEKNLNELEMPPKPSMDSLHGSTTSSMNCSCSTNSAT